LFSNKR